MTIFSVFAREEEGQEMQMAGKTGGDPLCNQLRSQTAKSEETVLVER